MKTRQRLCPCRNQIGEPHRTVRENNNLTILVIKTAIKKKKKMMKNDKNIV